jgi:hypothetical protein
MALSAFDDKARPPAAAELAEVLGRTSGLWVELVRHVTDSYPPVAGVWNHGGAKLGWSLRLKRKDRILLHLTPQRGQFLVGVVLGEAAAERAHAERLPDPALKLIDEAPRYGEGRGIRFAVCDDEDLASALSLVALKVVR